MNFGSFEAPAVLETLSVKQTELLLNEHFCILNPFD